MTISSRQIKLVRHTWQIFRKIDPRLVGDVFYGKLFLDYPELRPMFPRRMVEQYEKLVQMLNAVVAGLENMEGLQKSIGEMAVRHKGYGVLPEHYNAVGEALLWTLAEGLRSDWNDEVKEAWLTCYTVLARTMINAADPGLQ